MYDLLTNYGSELFAVMFGLTAWYTKKDLALYCFGASILALFTHHSGWVHESQIVAYGFITFMVAISSAAQYKFAKYPLSIAICIICCLTLMNQAAQVLSDTSASFWISYILGLSMVASLLIMDGRKEQLSDLANDFGINNNNNIHSHSGHGNGKGS